MKLRLILLCAALLAASPLSARKNNDVILMKNGDRITCEIKGLRSNTLYISVPYVLGEKGGPNDVTRDQFTDHFMSQYKRVRERPFSRPASALIGTPPCESSEFCLAKSSYTRKMNDLAQSAIQAFR